MSFFFLRFSCRWIICILNTRLDKWSVKRSVWKWLPYQSRLVPAGTCFLFSFGEQKEFLMSCKKSGRRRPWKRLKRKALWVHLFTVSVLTRLIFFFLNILLREDENTMRSSQRQPSGRATWTPTACWTVHPQMWRERRLWAPAVSRQHGTVLVCGPQRAGDPRDSLRAWQQTDVWVKSRVFIRNVENKRPLCLHKKNVFLRLSLLGIEHGGVRPPVGPTPRPDVYPLQPGTHLLFAQSGRIEHVPMDGYDMKKADAKAVLHLPVSWRNPPLWKRRFSQQLVQICFIMRVYFDCRLFVVWTSWQE